MFSERQLDPTDPFDLQTTINDIDKALEAPDLYEQDRAEIEANRAFFEEQRDRFMAVGGRTIKSTELAA